MGELTDRYVGATLRSIPEKQRADIEAELRASIGDEIDARVESGEDEESAEQEVLTALEMPRQVLEADLIIVILIVLAVTWDIVDGFRKARKAR